MRAVTKLDAGADAKSRGQKSPPPWEGTLVRGREGGARAWPICRRAPLCMWGHRLADAPLCALMLEPCGSCPPAAMSPIPHALDAAVRGFSGLGSASLRLSLRISLEGSGWGRDNVPPHPSPRILRGIDAGSSCRVRGRGTAPPQPQLVSIPGGDVHIHR